MLVFGGTTLLWQPERDLDSLFGLMADETGEVTGLREVDAGRLGGVMKCGTTSGQGGDFAVCGWADHGSVVMAMFPGRSVDEAAGLLPAPQIRRCQGTRGSPCANADEATPKVAYLECCPAVSYSPTPSRVQYHRRWRA